MSNTSAIVIEGDRHETDYDYREYDVYNYDHSDEEEGEEAEAEATEDKAEAEPRMDKDVPMLPQAVRTEATCVDKFAAPQ